MKTLKSLFSVEQNLPAALSALPILGLQYDSRKIKKGFLFFAIPGFKQDGSKFIPEVFSAGAAAALIQEGTVVPQEFVDRCIIVSDIRKSMAEVSAAFYDHPASKIDLLGVTGTKGKTSSTFLLESIMKETGRKTALIGGVECRHPGGSIASERTTMESLDLQHFLAEANQSGTEVAPMEVSSHALSLHRVWSCQFRAALFTNLYEDHLDFYGDMEHYFADKKKLFAPPYIRSDSILAANIDCPYGERLTKELPGDWSTFSLEKEAHVTALQIKGTDRGLQFLLRAKGYPDFEISSPLVGMFNVHNILGAVAIALRMGISIKEIQAGVGAVRVPGRLERVPSDLPFSVFIDFAHMGQALENVLRTLRPFCSGRLITVMGAGGDKDPSRRGQLGRVAAKLSDFTWITADNPRSEDPQKIMAAIEAAFLQSGGAQSAYAKEVDRRKAIFSAIAMAQPGDVICLAGKGHESGQIIGDQVYPFNDRQVAMEALKDKVDTAFKN